jgi:hypothetical protein
MRQNNLKLFFLIWFFVPFTSCIPIQKSNIPTDSTSFVADANLPQKTISQDVLNIDSLYKLLEKSLVLDTFIFEKITIPNLFYLKVGNFLSPFEKNAILMFCPNDSIFQLEYYTQKENKWIKNDSWGKKNAFSIYFYVDYQDFNFDEQNDIFIQRNVSNGASLRTGYLLILNPKTKKIEYHAEARKLNSMEVDVETKSIISEELVDCNDGMKLHVQYWTNKWIKGKLKTVKKNNPCVEDKK